METSTIVSVVFPAAICLVMFGLGLTLHFSDFTRILRAPAPVLIGLVAQVVTLPIIAFFLCRTLNMSADLSIGMMILSAAPSGAMANIFSRFARGDLALGLTLTAVGSVLSAVTLPFISGLAVRHFTGTQSEISFELQKTIGAVFIILVPVAIGMLLRAKKSGLADRMDRPLKLFSIIGLVLIVAGAVTKEWHTLSENLGQLGWIVGIYNLAAMGVGFFLPRLLKLPRNQAITISLGAGVHNATLSIYVAVSVLGSTVYALPSAIFGILMFFTAAALTVVFQKTAPR